MSTKKVVYGKFGTGSVAMKAHLASLYIYGSGYKGVTFGELKSYLNNQLKETVTKDKIYAVTRMLSKNGYAIEDNKDWKESKIYEKKYFSNK